MKPPEALTQSNICMLVMSLVLEGLVIHPSHVYVLLDDGNIMSLDTRRVYSPDELQKLVPNVTIVDANQDAVAVWAEKFNLVNPDIQIKLS